MRILHAKSLHQEVIRVGGVCPSMNLLALVSPQAITVYRVANLAAIATLRLRAAAVRDGSHLATCLAWSPSGRLLTVGFEGGWLLTMHVETGEVVRVFAPSSARAPSSVGGGGGCVIPPMILSDTNGGAGLKFGVTRAYSLTQSVVACHWQHRPMSGGAHHHRATPFKALESTACLSLAAMHVTAPMLAELRRTDDMPALVVLDVDMHLSIIVAGICEVRCLLLEVPPNISSVVGLWASAASSGASPNGTVGIAASPVRQMHVTDGGDLMLVLRTAHHTERLFCAPLGTRNWAEILNDDRVLTCVAVHEYMSVAQATVAECATRWSACMDRVFAECHLTTAVATSAAPSGSTSRHTDSSTAAILRTILLSPLCLQDKIAVETLLAKLSTARLLQALASLRSTFASVLSRMHSEAVVPFETALQLASTVVDAADPLYLAIGNATLLAEEFLVFARREGDNVATLVRWLLQLLHKRAQEDAGAANGTVPLPGVAAQLAAANLPSGSLPVGFELLRVEEHPVVLRTLHRIAHGTTTTGGVMQSSTVAELGQAFAQWQAHGMRLLPVYDQLTRRSQDAMHVFDVSSRYLAQPLASSATPTASLISMEPIVSSDVDEGDSPNATAVVRLFHVRESQENSGTPLVAAWAVHGNGAQCVLESGPAPVGLRALLGSDGRAADGGGVASSGVVAHAQVSDRHLIVAARGTCGVGVGLFEQNGEAATFECETDADDDAGGTKVAHDALLIDGLTASSTKPVELSVSGARGYGVIYNAERFILLQFDCV